MRIGLRDSKLASVSAPIWHLALFCRIGFVLRGWESVTVTGNGFTQERAGTMLWTGNAGVA